MMSHLRELEYTSLLERPLIQLLAELEVGGGFDTALRSNTINSLVLHSHRSYVKWMLSLEHMLNEPDIETR
jgi:hypothetical protein